MKIPILLATMRDILLTLVPRADREEVESSLDPDLLMQQLEHGILDLKRMSIWLARIFKAHCAPMRDQWVDQMVCQFERGVDKGDTRSLMEGWKSIFGILEAMKLVSYPLHWPFLLYIKLTLAFRTLPTTRYAHCAHILFRPLSSLNRATFKAESSKVG